MTLITVQLMRDIKGGAMLIVKYIDTYLQVVDD